MPISVKAFAKINLYLAVGGKRPDNFHYIQSLMHNISLHDTIELHDKEAGISLTVEPRQTWDIQQDIVYRTALKIIEAFSIQKGIRIILKKKYPLEQDWEGQVRIRQGSLRGLDICGTLTAAV